VLIVVVLALGAAAVYGTSDFFGAFAARRINLVTATFVNYAIASVLILLSAVVVGGVWSSGAFWSGVIAGSLSVFGLLAFYGVLAIGPMSLLSPLIALIQSVVPVAIAAVTGCSRRRGNGASPTFRSGQGCSRLPPAYYSALR
jgi:hypothetical protein